MKEVEIKSKTYRTHYALVDNDDFELVSGYKWRLSKNVNKTSGDVSFYAVTHVKREGGGWTTLHMHRLILGLEFGDKRWGDHINYKTLDNRRCNLRPCSPSESVRHRRKTKNTSSRYTGVCFNTRDKNWVSKIMVEGKNKHLGSFKTQKEAAIQYDKAAYAEYKEFTELNFPEVDHSNDNFDIEKYKTPAQKKKSSKFVGVYWDKNAGKWRSQIQVDKKNINLGLFTNEEDAARAYERYPIETKGGK